MPPARTYGNHPLEVPDVPAVATLAADHWGTLAPATWNRHVATLGSFTMFCRRRGWLQAPVRRPGAAPGAAPGEN